ncbi:DsbA family protein [Aquabacter sp. P-9]|uniref:DsbA family protein n=1 Tax=Aquabacter sediminis TaxID=3029197 RepID=UPI00237D93F7|nr:DsbA family protein [Aquabacter sp. P-9]MDE1567196.1 DsbA family protein [Aquabacter sp. P-9]
MLPRPGLRAALAFAAAFGTLATFAAPAAAFTDAEKAEMGPIIRDYLIKNPEVLQEAIMELEKRQAANEAKDRVQAVTQMKDLIFNSPRGVVVGNPKGDVTLVEFFDYNCGYCRKALTDIEQLIKADPKLKVVLREFPVLGQGSVEAAQVAVAVRMVAPDKYMAFHHALLSGRGQADRAKAIAAAKEVGIDTALIQKQATSPELNATLDESMKIAQALGLNGTPSFVVGNDVVIGAVGYDKLKDAVDQARKQATN